MAVSPVNWRPLYDLERKTGEDVTGSLERNSSDEASRETRSRQNEVGERR
jgi:hypothetical protein